MKTRWLAGCSLLLAVVLQVQAQSSHAATGVAYLRQEQYTKAIEEFRQALNEHPKDVVVWNLLGITETKLGDPERANSEYEHAIALNPVFPAARKNLAVNLMAAGRYAEAERQLQAALKLDASDRFLHAYLASLYLATRRDQLAVAELDAIGPLIESDPTLLAAMAKACLRLHENTKALELVHSGEAKQAFDAGEEYQIAALMSANRMYPEAVDRFRVIVKVEPENWVSRYDLALALVNADESKEAAAILTQLAEERPKDAKTLALLATAYEFSGEQEKALDAYRSALVADPDNADLRLDAARLLMEMDRYADAETIVQAGIERSKDPYALKIREGSIENLQGKLADARRSFQTAITMHPEIGLGYFALAQSYMRDGNDQQASEVLEIARQKSQPDAKIEYLRGLVLSHLGRHDQAEVAFRKSIRMDASAAEPHYELGRLLVADGSLIGAKQELERAAALAPDHANAFYQLSRLYARLGDPQNSAKMAEQTERLLAQSREKALEEQRAKLAGFEDVHRP